MRIVDPRGVGRWTSSLPHTLSAPMRHSDQAEDAKHGTHSSASLHLRDGPVFSFAPSVLGRTVVVVILRIQALLMLMLFGAGSLFGQLQVHLCLSTGTVFVGSHGSHSCCPSEHEPSQTCPHGDRDVPSPCESSDCCVVVAMPALDQPVAFQLRDLESSFISTPQSPQLSASTETPRVSLCHYLSRPPDLPGVTLNVLYSRFLI